MAVEQLFRSTFDKESYFLTRSEAEIHDLKLDVGEALSALFRHVLPNMSEDDAETLGIFMAERRKELSAALKKNPADIRELVKPQEPAASPVVSLAQAS
ncbi:YebG family protein [Pseudomonas putida]|uniref:YebG family protein n=1 Tax=Pseudomonas putida TaxID=303 RepID=UPI002364A50D|nr:YebG family protein [Pseudomonas putida]MDD2139690.1 YebG family protein [Pseudomonas putida]HDS1721614.1 YebG family protein [Pseudomonas putida]